jgi:hypothetical protein
MTPACRLHSAVRPRAAANEGVLGVDGGCNRCTRTEWFPENGEELARNVPEARFVGTG